MPDFSAYCLETGIFWWKKIKGNVTIFNETSLNLDKKGHLY
jgi:hypothetical protein